MSSQTNTKPEIAILVLIGIPGAGKSSFVNKYLEWLKSKPSQNIDPVHICYDTLVPLEIQKKTMDEPGLWKQLRTKIFETVDKKLHHILDKQCDLERNEFFDKIMIDPVEDKRRLVIIDDNNHLSSMRYPYYQMARKHEIGYCQLHLTTEIQTALRLNKGREGEVPDHVITNMAASLEPPDPFKNHWEKFSFSVKLLENVDLNFDVIQSIIETAFNNPERPPPDDSEAREKDRIACSASVVHQADKQLRSLVSNKMKSLKEDGESKENMKMKSTKYNEVRQEVLEDLKTGFTKLDKNLVHKVTDRKMEAGGELLVVLNELFEQKLCL